MENKKKLKVSAIENGTVIDHIPANNLFKVIKILELDKLGSQITFGTNLMSDRYGKKAIVKLTNVFFKESDVNKLILVAPQAKLNVIKDYKVVEKHVVEIPKAINGIVKCVNPKCITNHETVTTRYSVMYSMGVVSLKCEYCEKITDTEHMKIL